MSQVLPYILRFRLLSFFSSSVCIIFKGCAYWDGSLLHRALHGELRAARAPSTMGNTAGWTAVFKMAALFALPVSNPPISHHSIHLYVSTSLPSEVAVHTPQKKCNVPMKPKAVLAFQSKENRRGEMLPGSFIAGPLVICHHPHNPGMLKSDFLRSHNPTRTQHFLSRSW